MVERVIVGPVFTNAYIYSEWKKECIVLDPGGDSQIIISRLSLINMKPRGIVLTHGHIDHSCAVEELQEHYHQKGTDLQVAIHAKDKKYLGPKSANAHMASFDEEDGSGHDGFDAAIQHMPKADILLEEGDNIFESDLMVIHTPGHTQGSICIYSEAQEILFSGDTLLFEGIGRTDLPGSDTNAIIRNIREKVFVLPEATRIFPGHGPFTSIEREKKHNPFLN